MPSLPLKLPFRLSEGEERTATWKIPYPASTGDVSLTAADLQEVAERFEAIIKGRIEASFVTGDIKPSAAANPQAGWLLCDGKEVNRAAYAALFAAIGIACGPGDGTTTFNLPNAHQAAAIGASLELLPYPVGSTGGSALVKLTGLQSGFPSHTHSVSDSGQEALRNDGPTGSPLVGGYMVGTSVQFFTGGTLYKPHPGSPAEAAALEAQIAHENMPPWICVNYFIKT